MKIAIFSSKKSIGNRFLKKLIGEMKYKDVESFLDNQHRCRAVLKDGTEYLVLPANDAMRGHKFQKAYVSNAVPKDFVDTRIRPSFVPFDSIDIEYFDEFGNKGWTECNFPMDDDVKNFIMSPLDDE